MPLNKEARIQKIKEIKEQEEEAREPVRAEIPWKDKLEKMVVCQIPLECLIYNNLNGRILSETESLQTQKRKINPENEEDSNLIEKLLWESSVEKNENTLLNISQLGQQKPGIVTRDGIVIDGNRRLMLLNELKKKRFTKQKNLNKNYDYFKAVVLPVTREQDNAEIEKLEVNYQFGEDQKVDYNPIQLFLKIKNLYKTLAGRAYTPETVNKEVIKTIYGWIGVYKQIKNEDSIEDFLSVMNTMEDYLEYFQYYDIPLALEGRDEIFRELTAWLDNLSGEESKRAFDGYKDSDVDDLRSVGYELIRYKLPLMEFRKIAQGHKTSHFFGNKKIWSQFKDNHFECTTKVINEEPDIDYNSHDLKKHIEDRDKQFKQKIQNCVESNMSESESMLKNKSLQDQPQKLIDEAQKKLEAVNRKGETLLKQDTQKVLKNLIKLSIDLSSNTTLLEVVVKLLKQVQVEEPNDNNSKQLDLITQINKLSFEIKKQLGG